MSKRTMHAGVTLAALTIACGAAHAEWRCDCTRIAGSCNAQIEVMTSWLQVTTDQRGCARVEYLVDGQPFVALVVDGEHRQDWLTRTQAPAVVVQSCQMCADNTAAGTAAAPAAPAGTTRAEETPSGSAPDTPLISVAPAYPDAARGRTGEVVVELNVDESGTVTRARVLEARPPGVFDQSALDAVHRWRYPPGAQRVVQERLAFAPRAQPQPVASERAGAPRNGCVREASADELVDIVQAQLVNGCAEAVVVLSCAHGLAERTAEWACNTPVGLVPHGDDRDGLIGEIMTAEGRLNFGYADEYYLARPLGSRYALIACADGDGACYDAAAHWVAYLDGKPVDVDPRAGGEVEVAVRR
jgi:TonB family protein